jgi:alcohol dehydrogenase (NADP+)
VDVVGLGGLGYLAVQYARAMGCDPVIFSWNESKRDDGMKLGAKEFHVAPTSPNGAKLDVKDGVNILLLCGDGLPDFELYELKISHMNSRSRFRRFMPILAQRATIVPLIIQREPLVIP